VNSRRTAILALTAVAVFATSGCGVVAFHFVDYRHTTTPADTHIAGPVTELQVSADDGHVHVTTGGTGVTIHRVVHYQSGTPHPGQQLTGGILTFTNGCSRCRIDYDLTVPASVRVRARTDSGRIEVTGVANADLGSDSGSVHANGITGGVTAHSDSGSITLDGVGGGLTVRTDSAAIRATGVRSATTDASSDSGSIHMAYAAVPHDVRATTDSGSIRLTMPDAPYDMQVKTDSGSKNTDQMHNDTASPSKIYLRSDSGSVTVIPA
jgi:hypothetical protein